MAHWALNTVAHVSAQDTILVVFYLNHRFPLLLALQLMYTPFSRPLPSFEIPDQMPRPSRQSSRKAVDVGIIAQIAMLSDRRDTSKAEHNVGVSLCRFLRIGTACLAFRLHHGYGWRRLQLCIIVGRIRVVVALRIQRLRCLEMVGMV